MTHLIQQPTKVLETRQRLDGSIEEPLNSIGSQWLIYGSHDLRISVVNLRISGSKDLRISVVNLRPSTPTMNDRLSSPQAPLKILMMRTVNFLNSFSTVSAIVLCSLLKDFDSSKAPWLDGIPQKPRSLPHPLQHSSMERSKLGYFPNSSNAKRQQ